VSHPLDGYAWKRLRARQHFDALHDAINGFLTTHPFHLFTEFDPTTVRYLVKARVQEEPPFSISILVGDCLYNFRSALDHLAWQLVVFNGNQPSSRTEFPIFLKQERFIARDGKGNPSRGSGLDKMSGMATGVQSILEVAQPYNWNGGPADLHPLWLLHELSNEDKHRSLVVVGATMQEMVSIRAHDQLGREVSLTTKIDPQTFSDGVEVGYIDAVSMDPLISKIPVSEVQLVMMPKFNLAFSPDGPGRGLLVAATIVDIANTISKIATDLEPFIPDPANVGLSIR
jgi:hypothetical protein